jgi:hypothetical protein
LGLHGGFRKISHLNESRNSEIRFAIWSWASQAVDFYYKGTLNLAPRHDKCLNLFICLVTM